VRSIRQLIPTGSSRPPVCWLLLLVLAAACAAPASSPPPAGTAPGSTGVAAAPTGAATSIPPLRHVTVAYPAPVVTMSGFDIAIHEGYAREEGLDAEMVLMSGTLSAQGITAEQVDFGMSAGALLAARVRGAPIKNVFVQIDKPLYTLYGQPDLQGLADLVGKPVGISAVGDSTDLAVTTALKAAGVNPEQVTFVPNLNSSRAVAALQSGVVAATVTNPPVDLAAERLGYRNLGFLGDHLDYLTAGLATNEATIREQPALVRAGVRASLKAHRYMQQQRAGTIAHMARFQEASLEDATATYDRWMRYLSKDGVSERERLESMLRGQLQELGADQPLAVDEAFDLSFAQRAAQELNQTGWRPR
jgi:ABC-type nitrate/sulfonate/bicarbonate transport system substrate-binding protein